MKRKNGFTLVELLAVIVILSILMIVAVPNALKMSSKVKEKSYLTKIENIENAAKLYGENHINAVKGASCYAYDIGADKNIKKVEALNTKTCGKNQFPTLVLTVQDLAESNNLSYDNTNQYKRLAPESKVGLNEVFLKKYYDKTVVNPLNDNVINLCKVYIYYKFNNIYAWFDKTSCEKSPLTNRLLQSSDIDSFNSEYSTDSKLFKN